MRIGEIWMTEGAWRRERVIVLQIKVESLELALLVLDPPVKKTGLPATWLATKETECMAFRIADVLERWLHFRRKFLNICMHSTRQTRQTTSQWVEIDVREEKHGYEPYVVGGTMGPVFVE